LCTFFVSIDLAIMVSTSSDNAIVVSDIRSTSSGRRSNQLSPQPRPSQAEVALNAISELLERHKNNHRPQRSASQTDSDDAKTVDTELSIDHNFRLVAEVAAIVKNYQVGKEFPRSGIAGEDSEEDIQLPDGAAGPAHLIKRVRIYMSRLVLITNSFQGVKYRYRRIEQIPTKGNYSSCYTYRRSCGQIQ
jgi:hypothetical protein